MRGPALAVASPGTAQPAPTLTARRRVTDAPVRGARDATVGHSYKNDVSRRLSRIPVVSYRQLPERETSPNPVTGRSHRDAPDAARQTETFASNMPASILNFDGVGYPGVSCNCFPPDTNGEVGDTQYAQIVNQGLQVFNKSTGASVYGPVDIATLWSGFGGVCETSTFGDPVILYDQLANRWIVSQFAGNYPATAITD